jgi:hypothetical protein
MAKPMTPAAGSLVLVCLYLVELSTLASALTLQRQGDRSLTVFLANPAGWICVAALLALAACLIGLVAVVRRVPAPRSRGLAVPVVVNLCSVTLVFAVAEATVRALATQDIQGPVVAGTVLLPHRWTDVAARGRAGLERAASGQSYLVADPDLGWTIGPNRQSADYNREGVARYLAQLGLAPARPAPVDDDGAIYQSSAEGLRSPRAGLSFAAMPARRRIAVVGDSFTFGLEVRYENTWPHQLERMLGPEFQVLNFGVDGYGVDQAYLRYRRDGLAWRPEIVILGVIDDDFRRTMCVYAFLCFPGFGMPFTKPRFVVSGQSLAPLNLPRPAPEAAFAAPTVDELPFVDFDGSFDPVEWRRHFYDHSYAARFVLSRYRPWSSVRPQVTPEASAAVNAEIVRSFMRLAHERGAVPIVVFFPSRPRFRDGELASHTAKAVLEANRIGYLDMIPCVGRVPAAQRFVALHYSAASNAAVAGCLREALASGFQSR